MPHTLEPWYFHPWEKCAGFPAACIGIISSEPDPEKLHGAAICLVMLSHLPEQGQRTTAELLVRAPRMARVLKQLHYELSPLQVPPQNAELASAWRQACALVAELEKAGVL